MPESKGRPKKSSGASRATGHRDTRSTETERAERRPQKVVVGNPPWFVPVMLGLMLLGLLWIVVFYLSQQQYPVEAWGRWNLGAGFGLIMAGFLMTTRWR